MIQIKGPENDSEAADVTMILNNARINRDLERLKSALFKPPAIVAPFLSLPDVFIFLTVRWIGPSLAAVMKFHFSGVWVYVLYIFREPITFGDFCYIAFQRNMDKYE